MSFKQYSTYIFRKLGLIAVFDKALYYFRSIQYYKRNRAFLKENPGVRLPPPYFIYETYRLDYRHYYLDGLSTAKELARLINKHAGPQNTTVRLLDWGCGPGRVVRHMQDFFPGAEIYGTDYNEVYIDWCSKNISGIQFAVNGIEPPAGYRDSYFDSIIGYSIFTHLSLTGHTEWIAELHRIIRNNGILIISTQGRSFRDKLLSFEKDLFDKGELVLRKIDKEGHRLYSAFHPKEYVEQLVAEKFTVLEFIERNTWQDVWVLQKLAKK